jgi:hypothetical protein
VYSQRSGGIGDLNGRTALLQVIVNYLVDKYGEVEPDLMPHSPELRARGQLAIRFHDLYINNIQGCMYKAMDIDSRADMIRSLNEQLDVLEEVRGVALLLLLLLFLVVACLHVPCILLHNHLLQTYFAHLVSG